MRIKITDEEKNFRLWIPTRLLLNQLFASLLPVLFNKELRKYKTRITGSMCRKFVRGFYKTRRHFGGEIELVEVESKDGDYIKIVL